MDNQDWLLRQTELIGQGIGILMKKKLSSVNLGEIKDENGNSNPVKKILLNYMKEKDYDHAFQLVNSLKYKLSYYDFEIVSDWFITSLEVENQKKTVDLDQLIIKYSKSLKALL